MKNSNKKLVTWLIVLLIVIVLIIILHFFLNRFGKVKLIPTGNVDIFEIECNKGDNCQDKPAFGEDKEHDVEVSSENIIWNSTNDLRIFSNPAYEFDNIIAPGSSNTYNFNIKNNVDYEINYTLVFNEENAHNIPMVFRLKKNGKYILGNDKKWLDIHEFSANNNKLISDGSDKYSLEWKWLDSKEDAKIGMIDAIYKLNITIKAK